MGTIKNRDEWMRIYDWFPPTVALNNCIVSCVFLFIYIHAFHVIMETHLRGTLKSLRHHGTMIPRDLKGVLIWPPIITRGFSYSGFYLFFFQSAQQIVDKSSIIKHERKSVGIRKLLLGTFLEQFWYIISNRNITYHIKKYKNDL